MRGRDSEDDDGGDEGAGVPQGEGINMSEGEDGENGAALPCCFEGDEGVGVGGEDEGHSVRMKNVLSRNLLVRVVITASPIL